MKAWEMELRKPMRYLKYYALPERVESKNLLTGQKFFFSFKHLYGGKIDLQ